MIYPLPPDRPVRLLDNLFRKPITMPLQAGANYVFPKVWRPQCCKSASSGSKTNF